jgi:hypothetical protein
LSVDDVPNWPIYEKTLYDFFIARAEIAIAERTELIKPVLAWWIQHFPDPSDVAWKHAPEFVLALAEITGVWFDDSGNEVPLAEWKARVGE